MVTFFVKSLPAFLECHKATGGLPIEEEVMIAMAFQLGTWVCGMDGLLDEILHCLGFDCMGDSGDDGATLHDLMHGHGDGLPWNVVQGGKPAFAHLLRTAPLVQVHHDIRFFGGEIRGWIVEGNVAVLANAHDAHVDGFFPQCDCQFLDVFGDVAGAIHQMVGLEGDLLNQAFH